jgi:hypothetical protein
VTLAWRSAAIDLRGVGRDPRFGGVGRIELRGISGVTYLGAGIARVHRIHLGRLGVRHRVLTAAPAVVRETSGCEQHQRQTYKKELEPTNRR